MERLGEDLGTRHLLYGGTIHIFIIMHARRSSNVLSVQALADNYCIGHDSRLDYCAAG